MGWNGISHENPYLKEQNEVGFFVGSWGRKLSVEL